MGWARRSILNTKTRIRPDFGISSRAPLARFSIDNAGPDLSAFSAAPHTDLPACVPKTLLHQDRSYPRVRKPRGSGTHASCHTQKTTRSSGITCHIAACISWAASYAALPQGPQALRGASLSVTRPSRYIPLRLLKMKSLFKFWASPATAPPPVQISTNEAKPMFLDYVITMCDRIMRRAAEENPSTLCLQKISSSGEEKEAKTSKGGN